MTKKTIELAIIHPTSGAVLDVIMDERELLKIDGMGPKRVQALVKASTTGRVENLFTVPGVSNKLAERIQAKAFLKYMDEEECYDSEEEDDDFNKYVEAMEKIHDDEVNTWNAVGIELPPTVEQVVHSTHYGYGVCEGKKYKQFILYFRMDVPEPERHEDIMQVIKDASAQFKITRHRSEKLVLTSKEEMK